MQKKSHDITDFFPSSNLNNLLFYIHCPNLIEKEKRELSSLIIKNKGVRKTKYINIII